MNFHKNLGTQNWTLSILLAKIVHKLQTKIEKLCYLDQTHPRFSVIINYIELVILVGKSSRCIVWHNACTTFTSCAHTVLYVQAYICSICIDWPLHTIHVVAVCVCVCVCVLRTRDRELTRSPGLVPRDILTPTWNYPVVICAQKVFQTRK